MRDLQTFVKNYYNILEINSDVEQDDIKMAFRRLARRYHPDVNPNDKNAEDKFKEINEAYNILSDETKRQQYDLQLLGSSKRRRIPRKNTNKSNPNSNFSPFDDLGNFVDNLKQRNNYSNKSNTNSNRYRPTNTEAYRPGTTKTTKTINPRQIPRDIEAKLILPLEKAYQGGRERIRLEDGRSLEVDMPSAMYEGQKIRLKGLGMNNGDLFLKISIASHPLFQIQGIDISCEIPLTPSEAILGGSIEIPTIDGLVKMNVPPKVKSGQRLRLANKGYPDNNGKRGDQLVILQVVLPQEISQEEKELYEKIREIEQFNPRQALFK